MKRKWRRRSNQSKTSFVPQKLAQVRGDVEFQNADKETEKCYLVTRTGRRWFRTSIENALTCVQGEHTYSRLG